MSLEGWLTVTKDEYLNWNFIIQAFIALLVGAGVLYIAAPHSWGVGVFIQEPIYTAISLGISLVILIPTGFIFFRKKQKYFFSMFFFSFIGIALVVYFYRAPDRYSYPSDSLEEDVRTLLYEAGMPLSLGFDIRNRRKVAFDLFVEHRWDVRVFGRGYNNHKNFYYVERFGQGELQISDDVDWSELTSKSQ